VNYRGDFSAILLCSHAAQHYVLFKNELAKWINFYIMLMALFCGLERVPFTLVPIINPPFADISPLSNQKNPETQQVH
jgi:hypothetical protein